MLTIKSYVMKGYRKYAITICECGKEKLIREDHIRSGKIQSCGCYMRKVTAERMTTHGDTGKRLWGIWHNLDNKGARWNDYECFKEDVVSIPQGFFLQRIDATKEWGKDNFHFVDKYEVTKCRETTNVYNWMGKEYTVGQLANLTGFNASTISRRLQRNWKLEDALTIIPYRGRNQTGHKRDLNPIDYDALLGAYEQFAANTP